MEQNQNESTILSVKLSRIKVDKLFGYIDFDISELDSNPINFLIAQNGMGKTTTLNLLSDLSSGSFSSFYHNEFNGIGISFKIQKEDETEDAHLYFTKDSHGDVLWGRIDDIDVDWRLILTEILNKPVPEISAKKSPQEIVDWFIKTKPERRRKVALERCGRHYSVDLKGHMDVEKVIPLIQDEIDELRFKNVPPEQYEFLDNWNVRLIPYDRVRTKNLKGEDGWKVYEINNDMKKIMYKYGSLLTFEGKAVEDKNIEEYLQGDHNLDSIDLKELIDKVNLIEGRLYSHKLINNSVPVSSDIENLDGFKKETLRVLLKNRISKYESQMNFLDKLEEFENLLSDMFVFKNLRVYRQNGIVVSLKDSEKTLELKKLSSGEQHFLILLYKIFFETDNIDLVLIDEPETSLHVIWQERLIKSMEKIYKNSNVQFICATHSAPAIGHRHIAMKPIPPIS